MAKTDRLVLEIHKPVSTSNVVKIRPDAREVLTAIQRETGLSAAYIVSEMIKFSADKIEIKEVSHNE
ncbi:MAG: hypothetical protein HFE51_10960 [Clostridia bacterium]|nr:hypothetical protein [Clostridia bacterium]MCI9086916.1 hypothetical protein [Clostridia bacterium]